MSLPEETCKLSYRFLPWNLDRECLVVGEPMWIKPMSSGFWARMLTTTPEHPDANCIKLGSYKHSKQILMMLYLSLQFFQTTTLLQRQHTRDQLSFICMSWNPDIS